MSHKITDALPCVPLVLAMQALASPTYMGELLMRWGVNGLTTAAYDLADIYLVLLGWVMGLPASCWSAILSCFYRSSVEVRTAAWLAGTA